MKLDYLLLDVFTRERLRGNPLAVVTKADGLLDDQMQRIAAEFNLSETVFITKPKTERHSAAVRIFTPQVELPFAGHPTVGAAVVLGLELRSSAIRIEEKIGVITCVIERIDKARAQLGTVGSGNHYVDVFADRADGRIWVGVHFGSRGLGHTIASGFLALAANARGGSA